MTSSAAPSRLRTLDMAYIALFAVLMAVCAWIAVPLPKPLVQFTLQTFAMFMALTTLGGRRGLYAMVVYLLLGAVGVPVFSGFRGGLGVLLDTTGGYIIGFAAAALVYWLLTAKLGDSLPVKIAACVLGLAVCYAFGTAWFLVLYARTTGPIGVTTALSWCVLPYIVPDLLKLALAVVLSGRIKKFLK
ncbi:MAG: biotin transporter BioY [Oscillospiraceae bacterium]|nr:biotin transporter BioY [Oscillospiraceae bacterium]